MSAMRQPLVRGLISAERTSILPQTLAEWFLVISRVAIGWMWWEQTTWKLPPTFGCPANFAFTTDINKPTSGLCDFIGQQATYGALAPYRAFLTGFVMPNIQMIGWGVYLLELAIAISLIFGFLSRLGGLAGALQGVNLFLGFLGVPHEWHWTYLFLILLNLGFAAYAPGRILGVDYYLRQRFADARGLIGQLVRLAS